MTNEELQARIEKVEKDLESLNEEYYRYNFTTYQEFPKRSVFTVGLRVPVVRSFPEVPEDGYIVLKDGKLYVATARNTWVLIGSQT